MVVGLEFMAVWFFSDIDKKLPLCENSKYRVRGSSSLNKALTLNRAKKQESMESMGLISINAVKPGMVLAQDVRDRNGRLLIRQGNELSDEHLRILRIWGVVEADVEGADREELEGASREGLAPEILERAKVLVLERFQHNDSALPAVAELIRFCTLRKARELQDQPAKAASRPEPARETASPALAVKQLKPVDPLRLLTEDTTLGSLPIVFQKLLSVLNDSRSSATDVAEVISNDTDLSAKLLRIVNSAFYGIRSKIDTISRAVTIIGSNQLLSLAMGLSIINFFKGIPSELVDMASFWQHSVSCGIAARLIASFHRTPNTERFFVTGLLHDIGRLFIFKELPDYAKAILVAARARQSLLTPIESEILGFTHQKLGGALLKHWKFPVSLEKNVRYHHEPAKAVNRNEAAIILLADVMAHALEHGSSGECYVPRLDAATWDCLGLPLAFLGQTAVQVDYQLDEILKFFMTE